jgi:hypothetical protein
VFGASLGSTLNSGYPRSRSVFKNGQVTYLVQCQPRPEVHSRPALASQYVLDWPWLHSLFLTKLGHTIQGPSWERPSNTLPSGRHSVLFPYPQNKEKVLFLKHTLTFGISPMLAEVALDRSDALVYGERSSLSPCSGSRVDEKTVSTHRIHGHPYYMGQCNS